MSRMTKGAVFAAALMLCALSLPQAQAASNGTSDPGTGRAAVGPKVALGVQPKTGGVSASLALGPDEAGIERSRVTDPDGTAYVHYDRTWQGKRVIGGDFIATVGRAGAISEITWNRGLARVSPDRTVRLSAAQAMVAPARPAGLRGATATAELVVWAGSGTPRMAYDVLTVGIRADQTPTRLHTIIDAVTGATLTAYDEVFTGTGHTEYSGTVTPRAARARSSPTRTMCGGLGLRVMSKLLRSMRSMARRRPSLSTSRPSAGTGSGITARAPGAGSIMAKDSSTLSGTARR